MAVSEKQDSNLLCPDGEGVTTLAHSDVYIVVIGVHVQVQQLFTWEDVILGPFIVSSHVVSFGYAVFLQIIIDFQESMQVKSNPANLVSH